MFVYANGSIVPAQEATVPAMDHGFLYGIGLFETVRVYDNQLFLWKEHFARLSSGLLALRIKSEWTEVELAKLIMETIAANQLINAYVRLSITGGAEGVGLVAESYERPALYIFVKTVSPITEPPTVKRLQTISFPRQTPEGLQRFKSHNYLNNALARLEIGQQAEVEGLFVTTDGYLCEGIVGNLFWVKEKELYTPSLGTGCLDGVTRRHVINLAKQLGVVVRDGFYGHAALREADEVFLTNSIQEIVPVSEVDGVTVKETYGHVTRNLHSAYRRSVELGG